MRFCGGCFLLLRQACGDRKTAVTAVVGVSPHFFRQHKLEKSAVLTPTPSHRMIRFGLLPLISGALQLCVPSYALRLLRRFGAQRVGWFLVIAFSALALAHLLDPLKPLSAGPTPGLTLDPMYAIASVLLLIGMSHMESLFAERVWVQQQEKRMRSDWQLQIDEKSASCQELLQEIAGLRKEKEILGESEALYRFLFVENPQAMWILDLRSLRFLTVN